MSEREVIENAKRKGRRAYWQGIPLEANPMRSLLSKHAWAEAWKKERDEMDGRRLARENWSDERAEARGRAEELKWLLEVV